MSAFSRVTSPGMRMARPGPGKGGRPAGAARLRRRAGAGRAGARARRRARPWGGDAEGEAGAGEGVAAADLLRDVQLAAEHADLVLEQLAERLDQLHAHALGQAADVVV